MSETEKNDRVKKVVQGLLETGWRAVIIGDTVVYQKPAPIREPDERGKRKPKRQK